MNVALSEFGGKSDSIKAALLEEGHTLTRHLDERVDVLLIDHVWENRWDIVAAAANLGVPTVLYPHGGGVPVDYDGVVPTDLPVALHMVHAEGHRQIMAMYGYPHPTAVLGWNYTPVLPFTPVEKPRRILFAPHHPWADGHTLEDAAVEINRHAYDQFRKLPGRKTCRFVGHPLPNGIGATQGVTFIQAEKDNSYQDVLNADVVIAVGTFAFMAVALGKPTVMLEWFPENKRIPTTPAHWDEYKDELRYPYRTDDGPLADVIAAACAGGPELTRWRSRFIGEPMTSRRLNDLIESVRCSKT